MDDELREFYSEDISILSQFSPVHSTDASAFPDRISVVRAADLLEDMRAYCERERYGWQSSKAD